ncbi:chloride channel protein [Marinobacter nauticus]|uniref:Voltage-gated chloride channel n=2 Tax=Marinobacter nauticus TaxID=2743 RepID=A0A495IAG9_MARNT|nr:chloride channel protein [Marinobacter nauticus]MEC9040690.1 chloride channel protein [Pseudomonadota bacterium]KAE8545433.1 Voltage-gated chloride channel [Marinobacter nauticus]MCC4271247.1 chloride channel protein [Marinobacter nauticus]RKR72649.1 CIC family chloride channel protein [Marinobacter nauticus]CCG94041.1 Voltage-gated ClC-type chloride channel clcA [Marinobacter nauticus ATCC 49840]
MRSIRQQITENLIPVFRRKLSGVDALPQLAVLGLLSGIVTGGVILLFRLAIEWPLEHFLPGQGSESFEELDLLTRGLLPLAGALGLGLLLHKLALHDRKVGIVHIMERLNYHQGYISFRSAMVQFVSGVTTVITGQSAGREGPAVHLGAAFSSLLGQWMRLPNNSIRTLVACGCAAAISASFNTPISGVIFAMEVVMMEYTIAGFTPIILAAVSAAIVTQAVYGTEPAFSVPALTMNSLLEIPWILAIAVIIGIAAAGFIQLVDSMGRYHHRPVLLRIAVAGLLMVPFALVIPETMGIGYDTVSETIHGELGFWLLLGAGSAKLIITGLSIGLGMPSGVIGPTIFMGATLGGAMGLIGAQMFPDIASSVGFYAMLGMGAMMGAVLQAPLAALMALMELTRNPNIILPGMLMITTASLVTSEAFGKKSLFLTILKSQGLSYQNSPVIQALRRVSVGAIMERNILRTERALTLEEAKKALKSEPKWLLVEGSNGPTALLPAVDLARFLEDTEKQAAEEGTELPESIDLMEIPANRRDVAPVQYQATLEEALQQFDSTQAEALYVQRHVAPMIQRVYGVVLQTDIESYYQYRRS